jgi:hypothetical protein
MIISSLNGRVCVLGVEHAGVSYARSAYTEESHQLLYLFI